MTHTEALRYSPWERLVFRLRGRWPQAVVNRRLLALALDERGTQTGTSVPVDSDNPQNVGSKPERRQNWFCWKPEDYPQE